MTNRKGPRFEKELLDYLRDQGYDAERLRTTGKDDEGDIRVFRHPGKGPANPVIIEAKNCAKVDLAGWCAEAEVEKDNYLAHRNRHYGNFAVVHKRRGKGPAHAYVTMPLYEFLEWLG